VAIDEAGDTLGDLRHIGDDAGVDVRGEPVVTTPARAGKLSVWMFVVAALVFVILVVGGATRLTESGLSMVDWEPVTGVVPPLSESDWQAEFDAYQSSPEYQIINQGMTLGEFKTIYLWEYLHRLLGRVLGLAMALPFLWFLAKKAIPHGYGWRLFGLVLLVGLQGAIGWWMVASGLVDRPDVAHERLALHLTTALVLLCALLWTALDFLALATGRDPVDGRPSGWFWPFTVLLFVQITLGAFVAGLDAGHMYTTWPTMQGEWVPEATRALEPIWTNAVDNPVAVQFLHRWLAMVIAVYALVVAVRLYRGGAGARAGALAATVLLQFVLGVLTLVNAVPIPLGVAHQAGAVLLLVATIVAGHWSMGGARRRSTTVVDGPVTDVSTSVRSS
jgi:cytochrome c oxidase assembly protein subunit 15